MTSISREAALSELYKLIEHMHLPKRSSNAALLSPFFSTIVSLLMMIRVSCLYSATSSKFTYSQDSMAHEKDYIMLGCFWGGVCNALERRVDEKGLDDTARNVMNRLTT